MASLSRDVHSLPSHQSRVGSRKVSRFFCENETSRETNLGVVLDTPSEGPDRLFVPIVTVIVPIVTQYT